MASRQLEDVKMARKRHTAEEIVSKLRQVDALTAQGRPVAEAVRAIGVSEVTYHRWRSEYGGLKGDQVKRLRELEAENTRLRRAVSDIRRRGGADRRRRRARHPVRPLRLPPGHRPAAGGGLGGEPQAGRADLATGGAEGPAEATQEGPALAP
jgi:putative transposase